MSDSALRDLLRGVHELLARKSRAEQASRPSAVRPELSEAIHLASEGKP